MVVVTSLGPPEEGVRLRVDNVATYIDRKQLGMGSLFISEARILIFVNGNGNPGNGKVDQSIWGAVNPN